MKIKPLFGTKHIDEILLSYLKEKAPLYVRERGIKIIKTINKEDTSITSFPKTVHWMPLVPNAESLYNTTYPYFFK